MIWPNLEAFYVYFSTVRTAIKIAIKTAVKMDVKMAVSKKALCTNGTMYSEFPLTTWQTAQFKFGKCVNLQRLAAHRRCKSAQLVLKVMR